LESLVVPPSVSSAGNHARRRALTHAHEVRSMTAFIFARSSVNAFDASWPISRIGHRVGPARHVALEVGDSARPWSGADHRQFGHRAGADHVEVRRRVRRNRAQGPAALRGMPRARISTSGMPDQQATAAAASQIITPAE